MTSRHVFQIPICLLVKLKVKSAQFSPFTTSFIKVISLSIEDILIGRGVLQQDVSDTNKAVVTNYGEGGGGLQKGRGEASEVLSLRKNGGGGRNEF